MCIGMANGGKSLTEDLRKKSASEAIKSFQETGTSFTNAMVAGATNSVFEIINKFNVEVVEKQESIIMQAIQRIGGEEYSHITIDKNKVVDAFKKQMPRKLTIDENNGYPLHVCPCCNDKFLKLIPHNYCQVCGQAFDWSDTDEQNDR